jgi:crotonobetainyl-CoA:carnitine CoA-transferase CaiB-like acyl-CoA transferase
MLADLGADVIKVEDPTSGGDVSRYIPPVTHGTDSLFFEAFNRSKRSLLLDLKSAAGREVFERLVASADAVFSNLRGDQPVRLRLTYDDLRHVNERIVCVALTGYGRGPADAGLFGYDALVQAEAGWAALTGGPDDPPTKSGLSLADYMTGLVAMIGLLAAVIDARATGRGRDVDTDLFDAALGMLSYPATWYLSAGISQGRLPLSAHPSVVPFGFFATADGHIAVAAPKERFFGELVRAMDLSELASDARFANMAARARHREALVAALDARFAERTTDEWMERLRGIVPAAPVRSLEEALDPARLAERGMLAEYDHPTLGHVRSVGVPLFISDYEPSYRPGPGIGADEGPVLEELGYEADAIEELRAHGAFGRPGAGEPEVEEAATGAAL